MKRKRLENKLDMPTPIISKQKKGIQVWNHQPTERTNRNKHNKCKLVGNDISYLETLLRRQNIQVQIK